MRVSWVCVVRVAVLSWKRVSVSVLLDELKAWAAETQSQRSGDHDDVVSTLPSVEAGPLASGGLLRTLLHHPHPL